jgi:hypothetical protein
MSHVAGLLLADGPDFLTRSVACLDLTFAGIAGDRHAGRERASDVRTPWHRRGTSIANTRQLSIVSQEECAEIADLLGVPSIDPALLGANLLLAGVPALSFLYPGTRLRFPSGATVFVTEQNAPCRHPAAAVAAAYDDPKLAAAFVKAALGRRGLVGLVESEWTVSVGDPVGCLAPPGRVTTPALA